MKLSREQIKNLLSTKVLARYLKEKALKGLIHEIPNNPRLPFQNENSYGVFMGLASSEEKNMTWHYRDSFLTGGALCALILEKFKKVPPVINDVDIFYYQFSTKNASSADREMYENLIDENHHYQIEEVQENGLLNLIKILPGEEFNWTHLLDSFDLNYAQVGLVLAENRLVFTDEFIDFLFSQEISFTPDFDDEYPLTSYLRGIHKSLDLQSKFYLQEELKGVFFWNHPDAFLTPSYQIALTTSREEAEKSDSLELVTAKRLDYWKTNPQILGPWLTLDESQLKINLPEEPWVEFMKFLVNKGVSNQKLSHSNNGVNYYKSTPTLFNKFKGIKKILSHNKNFYKRLKIVIETNLIANWERILPANSEAFSKDFSIEHLTKISNFCHNHERLSELFEVCLQLGWDMNETLSFFQKIKNLSSPELGFLEGSLGYLCSDKKFSFNLSHHNSTQKDLLTTFSKMLESKDSKRIIELIKKEYEKIKVDQELTTPVHHPFKKFIREIFLLNDLIREGEVMHHCCGGFAKKIKDKQCRIFHLEYKGEKSTLEVIWEPKILINNKHKTSHPMLKYQDKKDPRVNYNHIVEFKIKQNKAHYNRVPHPKLQHMAQRLIAYLNNYRN